MKMSEQMKQRASHLSDVVAMLDSDINTLINNLNLDGSTRLLLNLNDADYITVIDNYCEDLKIGFTEYIKARNAALK